MLPLPMEQLPNCLPVQPIMTTIGIEMKMEIGGTNMMTMGKENKIIFRLLLVIAMYLLSRQFKPYKINHSTSPAASWLGRKPTLTTLL